MSPFSAGSAVGTYVLDISDAVAKANQLKTIFAGIAQAQKTALTVSGGNSGSVAATNQANNQTRALTQLRNSEIAAARAAGDHARALKLIQAELAQAAQGTVRYNQLLAQQSRAQAALARSRSGGLGDALPRTFAGFTQAGLGQLAGITSLASIGPQLISLTTDSFKLKAALDQTTTSIDLQLRGVRQSGIVFADAQRFAAKYNLTQEETNQALKASVGILRNSTSSASDLLGVLARLQISSPEQGLEGAALAVKELQGGDIQSLVERFEISRTAANKMKAEIQGGADAVTVLGKYLTDSGIGMQSLEARTQGATGKMNELRVETEKFKLSLGGEAGGVGVTILEGRIRATSGATRILTGDFESMKGSIQTTLSQALQSFEQANPLANAFGQFIDRATGASAGLAAASTDAAIGVLRSADADDRVADSAARAIPKIQGLTGALLEQANATALADQRKSEQTGTDLSADQFNKFSNLRRARDNEIADDKKEADKKAAAEAKRLADKAAAEADKLADLQLQSRLIKAKDSAAKIKILQAQLAKTTDPIERQQLQNQIDQERLSSVKKTTSALDKQLTTQESIYDSIQKQKDALLDIEELTIRDRQQDREDATKAKTAQAIIRALGGRTDSRANDLRARAQDAIALADVQNRKREFEIASKQTTAGGTITAKGRLLQSRPGGIPAPADSVSSNASATSPAATTGAQGNVLTVNVLVDGKTAWTGMAPFAWDDLMHGVQSVKVAKGA